MGEITRLGKKYRYGNHYYTSLASNDYNYVLREIELVEKELSIQISDFMRTNIVSAYQDTSYVLKLNDLKNSMMLIKLVYYAIYGSIEGLDDFINSRKVFAYSSYHRMNIRLAIFNHFNFLEDVFVNKPELLISKFFNSVSTTDIYKILSLNKFNDLDEFITFVKSLTHSEKEEIHSIQINKEVFAEISLEFKGSLKTLKKRNVFLKMMNSRKK